MCKALLGPPASSPSTPTPSADHGVRPGGEAAACAGAAAPAAAPVSRGDLDNAPRYRRPRCTCQASTANTEQQKQQQQGSAIMTAVGGSGLGDNGCTATEMLPMVAESGVPLESSPFSGGGRSVQMPCPSCDLAPTRAGAELARAASVTEPKEGSGPTWSPEAEFNPQVAFEIINSHSALSGARE